MSNIPVVTPFYNSGSAVIWRSLDRVVFRFVKPDLYLVMVADLVTDCGHGLAGRQRAMELAGVALYDSDQTPSPDSADPYHDPRDQFAVDGQPEAPEPIPARYRE